MTYYGSEQCNYNGGVIESMAQIKFIEGFEPIRIDKLMNVNVDILNKDVTIAQITLHNPPDAVWLQGEVRWIMSRPGDNCINSASLFVFIKRNGDEIFYTLQDGQIIPPFNSFRGTTSFMWLDETPGCGPVTYELVASGRATGQTINDFRVIGDNIFFLGGIES